MREYKFYLTRVFPCKDRIADFAPKRENTGHRNTKFWHI